MGLLSTEKKKNILAQLNKNGEENVFLNFDADKSICMYTPEENAGL